MKARIKITEPDIVEGMVLSLTPGESLIVSSALHDFATNKERHPEDRVEAEQLWSMMCKPERFISDDWILVTDKLPDDPAPVLVTVLWHYPYNNVETTIGEYWDEIGWGDWLDGEVIAWKPLPEPYRK